MSSVTHVKEDASQKYSFNMPTVLVDPASTLCRRQEMSSREKKDRRNVLYSDSKISPLFEFT